MRDFSENVYVFTMSRQNQGKIIACRTDRGNDPVGQNFFRYLGIDGREEESFKRFMLGETERIIAVLSERRRKRHPVLILRDFYYDTGIFVAFELFQNAHTLAKSLADERLVGISMSDGVFEASRDPRCENVSARDEANCYWSLCSLRNRIRPLVDIGFMVNLVDLVSLRNAILAAAEIANVKCEVDILSDVSDVFMLRRSCVFSSAAMTGISLIMALVAGTVSDKTLLARVNGKGEDIVINFGIRLAEGEIIPKELEIVRLSLESNHGMCLDICPEQGGFFASLIPSYIDEGLCGEVKVDKPKLIYDFTGANE